MFENSSFRTILLTKNRKPYRFYESSCLLRLEVRTAGFHPANRGSSPLGDIEKAIRGLFFSSDILEGFVKPPEAPELNLKKLQKDLQKSFSE